MKTPILKNEEELKFYSFLYSERRLSFSFISYVLEQYSKLEAKAIRESKIFDVHEVELNEIDFKEIISLSEKIDISKKKEIFTVSKSGKSVEGLIDKVSYLLFKDEAKYYINHSKFNKLLIENFSNISIESPSFLAESIKMNLQNIMDREFSTLTSSTTEQNFLININKDRFKLSAMNKSMLSLKSDFSNTRTLSENLLKNVEIEVNKISAVNISLKTKTELLLNSIEESSITEQILLIEHYLKNTELALVQFFNGESNNSMNYYLRKADLYFKVVDYKDIEWNIVYRRFKEEKAKLVDSINDVILSLKSKGDSLKKRSAILNYLDEFMINPELDSSARIKEKEQSYMAKFNMIPQKESSYMSLTFNSFKGVNIDELRETYTEINRERMHLSEEELEERKEKAINDAKLIELEKTALEIKSKNLSAGYKKLYKVFKEALNDFTVEQFIDKSQLELDKIIEDMDIYAMFNGSISKEEISDKRVLYKTIEILLEKEYL